MSYHFKILQIYNTVYIAFYKVCSHNVHIEMNAGERKYRQKWIHFILSRIKKEP